MCDDTQNCDVDLVTIKEPAHVDLRYNLTDPCGFVQPGDALCQEVFRQTCRDWANDIEAESKAHGNKDYDTMEWIGHIGFWVDRQNSCHCAGLAADISKIQWNGTACSPCNGHHEGTQTQIRRYLAVDASLRKYFKWTLDGWYNDAHADHFHASSHYETPLIVLSKESMSDTAFVQAVCINFNDADLVISGNWGGLTDAAFEDINAAWDYDVTKCDPFLSHNAYNDWLHRVMAAGFANKEASAVRIHDSCIFTEALASPGASSPHVP
jgi:hypothetical protein